MRWSVPKYSIEWLLPEILGRTKLCRANFTSGGGRMTSIEVRNRMIENQLDWIECKYIREEPTGVFNRRCMVAPVM